MKIILRRKIDGCQCHRCSEGYSYDLCLWNILLLSKNVEKEDFVKPSDKNEIDALFNGFIQSTTLWIKGMERARQIKLTNYTQLRCSNALELSPYQTKAFEMCQALDRCFLFMEQGTGKTPVALAIINSRKDCSSLIVCPKAVRKEWANMIDEFFPGTPYTIIKDNKEFKPEPGHVYIVNYDRARTMEAEGFSMIIADECHRLKNPTSASNKKLYELQKQARYVYGLTGTPYSNNLVDIFGICKVVDERLFGLTKSAFEDRYCNIVKRQTKDGREFPIVQSYKNIDELKKKLDSVSYRVLKKDCLDLIDPIDSRLWVDNTNDYTKMKNDYVLETKNGIAVLNSVLNLTFKLQQICSGFIKNDDDTWSELGQNKLSILMDWIIDQGEEQAIIYITYDMSELMICKRLSLNGYKFGVISGHVSDDERENYKQKFKNKEIQFLVIKYKSGTEGLNFQNCNKMVFYDLTTSLIDYEQAKSRIHRRGQERECEYVHLITENSVEEKIYKALKQRKDFSEYILEGNEI